MKLETKVPTGNNISTTPVGVYEVSIDALLQGNMEDLI